MKDYCIDYRGDTRRAARDLRARLRIAGSGQVINFVCNDEQVIRLLREITFNDGVITKQETTEKGVSITIRKT
jgi:TusA-related sulfurtransferase